MKNWNIDNELINQIMKQKNGRLNNNLLHLLLLFNCFESSGMTKSIFLTLYTLDIKYYENIYIFFKDRYVINGKINENNFYDLFKDKSEKEYYFLRNNITKEFLSTRKKLKVCMIVAYRFRNNIFHGNKIVAQLENYNDCYEKIIEFLRNVLMHAKEKDNG